LRSAIIGVLLAGASALASRPALAEVTEPNGTRVPLPPTTSGEKSLQSYFDGLSPPQTIDALADASAEPSTFSPLCGFEARLVLSESSAAAGLAWYNVPADPSAVPAAIHQVVPETTMIGATISSAAIRGDPGYEGKLIGFALTKGGKAVYYSEAERNANCSGCAMPGHWKMMLAYASKRESTTYYLAWEDWEGANESGWPDDGDFNDKLFELTGVRCAGGGEPCDTGRPGVCAPGLSECQMDGTSSCKPIAPAQPESCDGVDNDCNGAVDDGAPCPPGEVCQRGACVEACGTGEFICLGGTSCDEGYCVEPACAGMRCETGLACRAGACVAACDGIVCPYGQQCSAGACSDACRAADCGAERVCRGGVCVERCTCAGCPQGLVCEESSGQCVQPGCEKQQCAAGSACVAGQCIDRCGNAKCPHGAACVAGVCQDPTSRALSRLVADAGAQRGPDGGAMLDMGRNAAGTKGARVPSERAGCSCELALAAVPPRNHAEWLALALGLASMRRLRRAKRSRV
jgi:hypothetical protein